MEIKWFGCKIRVVELLILKLTMKFHLAALNSRLCAFYLKKAKISTKINSFINVFAPQFAKLFMPIIPLGIPINNQSKVRF